MQQQPTPDYRTAHVRRLVEGLRPRLIDLSGRNRSVSFRHTDSSRREMRIVAPALDLIWERLYEGRKLAVLSLPQPSSGPRTSPTDWAKANGIPVNWGAPGKAGPDGLYWTPAAPQGSRANYRRDYVICPEWNDLDRVRTCSVRPWALVAVGPGAAAKCKDGTVLAASEVPQVLIIPKWNPGAQQYQLPVEACSDTTATWAP